MHVIHARCAGIDLGKDTLVVALRLQEAGRVVRECRTYQTTSRQLLDLSSWLVSQEVTHVVMEATGSYWKSAWHVLEGQFDLMLVNPAMVKNMPGRKSDVNDATWLADLLAHGLVRGSFVPPAEIGGLRELTRTRRQLGREIARHTQRIQKLLDASNIKVTGTITDLMGLSGRAIVRAIVRGEADPERLADLASTRLKAPRARLVEVLHGQVTDQRRLLLGVHLDQIEGIEAAIVKLDRNIEKAVDPFRDTVNRLIEVPGLSTVSVSALLGEIGVDMSKFRTHRHIVSWATLCPRLHESAGKILSRRTRKGSVWVKSLLVQAALAASRNKKSYFRAQFLRLRARIGPKKAIVAVAASLLTAVYYIIRDGKPFKDLGINYFDGHDRTRAANRHVYRLKQLGFNVQLTEAQA
jgi:transposase